MTTFADLETKDLCTLLRNARSGFWAAAEKASNGDSGEFVEVAKLVTFPAIRQIEAILADRGISVDHPTFGKPIPECFQP